MRAGIKYNKTPLLYAPIGDVLLKMLKYFEVMIDIFEFAHIEES